MSVFAALGGGLWMGYRYIRPDTPKSEPSKPPDTPPQLAAPPQEPRRLSREERAYRPRVRPTRRQAEPPAETAQADNAAPITPQTSQAPAAAPPAPAPATEARPLLRTQPQEPGCKLPPPPPTNFTIPPGEKSPEPDELV